MALECFGFSRVKDNSGYAIFECYEAADADKLARRLPFRELVFARQMMVMTHELTGMDLADRIAHPVREPAGASQQQAKKYCVPGGTGRSTSFSTISWTRSPRFRHRVHGFLKFLAGCIVLAAAFSRTTLPARTAGCRAGNVYTTC